MTVSDAIASRHSARAFLDRPVDPQLIKRILGDAARSPSGGNLQPWRIYALAGEPLQRLKDRMDVRTAENPEGEGADGEGVEYDIYPRKLAPPYKDHRFKFGETLYGSLGIAREDREGRQRWMARNYRFYDAPVGIFVFVERYMGAPQWSDLGMYLQTAMLLLYEAGLASCAQECWARYARTVYDFIAPPENLQLFCGLAVGYADAADPVNQFRAERAPLEEFATFLGFP